MTAEQIPNANSKQAEKRVRQANARRERNRVARGQMRSLMKDFRSAVEAKDAEKVRQILPAAVSRIDKTAKRGIIHRNTAKRYKSWDEYPSCGRLRAG